MPYLKREGRTRVYYEVHGSGATLLLTHGYSSTSGMWHGQIDAFTTAGYQFIIWDMRGHGRSSYPDDPNAYSEAHTVADMAALLDKVCGEGSTAIVGGLSLGGYMSQAFYRLHPQRVQSLLIIGIT
jgi:pimeloyl-ACP methyl ester carboxylesterase